MEKQATTLNAQAVSTENILIKNVYTWMCVALLITGFTAYYAAGSYAIMEAILSNKVLFFGLFIAQFVLVIALTARIQSLSFSAALSLFILYSFLNGITMSVIFLAYTSASIASTFFVTAGTFGAMSLYGYFTKKDLTSIGNLCMMALLGLIIASVVNLFFDNELLYWITTYAGVLIFVGLTAYDTQKIKEMLHGQEVNEDTQKFAIIGALKLYLDFINLFLYLLRLFGKRR